MNEQTIGDIIEKERQLFYEAESKYGDFFANASSSNALLQNFIKEVNLNAWIFAMFLSQVRKHHTLALFSVVRLHHIQAILNLRQVLEAGANAVYAIANPNKDDFAISNEDGTLDATQKLTTKRYKWLEEKYPAGSEAIKKLKNIINKSCAHSNIIYAQRNFKMAKEERPGFQTPFFDIEDEYLIKTDLWMVGNIVLVLMDLFNEANKSYNIITFSDDFVRRLLELDEDNRRLKAEMMRHPRFIKTTEIYRKKNHK